ncbi:prepilin-type N-terminal cleavage/methylation domain-containing protein [Microbacterium sp. PA5]|uniref:prepilin-type N-terminal cleavage/methylation domain-containing protein n=1 Tax=Microbacterium sp. PA5 TaxID=3416654 RepID=UPI003CED7584
MFQRSDDGFSLVEMILAMFLLAVLSLAVLPLLISATALSIDNRDRVTATALADAHISALRAQFPVQPATTTTCAQLRDSAVKLVDADPMTLPNVAIPAGFTRTVTVAACPTGVDVGKPAAILVTVRVTPATGKAAVLQTRIAVTAG